MALIDKDQVKAEIERRLKKISKSNAVFTQGKRDAYKNLLSFLDTQPDEPKSDELDKEIDRSWNRDTGFQPGFVVLDLNKEDYSEIARHFYELGQQSRPKKSDNSLEEEIEKYFQGWINDLECGDALTADCTGVDVDKCKEIARHFAEWGAEHAKE